MTSISNGESGSSVRSKLNTLLGGVQYVLITITSSQLLNAATAPVEVIPAPGVGKRICIISFAFSLGGTTNYVSANDSALNYGNYGDGSKRVAYVFSGSNNYIAAGTISQGIAALETTSGRGPAYERAKVENQPINYTTGNLAEDNLTGGDGDMKLTVFYAVVDI